MPPRPLQFRVGHIRRVRRARAPTEIDPLLTRLDADPDAWDRLSEVERIVALSALGGEARDNGPVSRVRARELLEQLSSREATRLTERISRGTLSPKRAKLAAFLGYRPALHLGRPDPMLFELTRWDPEEEEAPEVELIAESYGAEAATRIAVARGGTDPLLVHVATWLDHPKDPAAVAALTEAFGGEAAFDAGLQLWVTQALAAPGEDWWRRARDLVLPWVLAAPRND